MIWFRTWEFARNFGWRFKLNQKLLKQNDAGVRKICVGYDNAPWPVESNDLEFWMGFRRFVRYWVTGNRTSDFDLQPVKTHAIINTYWCSRVELLWLTLMCNVIFHKIIVFTFMKWDREFTPFLGTTCIESVGNHNFMLVKSTDWHK